MPTPRVRRLAFGTFASVFVLAATVLNLSDQAPGWVDSMWLAVLGIGDRVADVLHLDVGHVSVPFEFDQLGHAFIWGVGMLGLGLGLRRKVSSPLLAIGLIGVSLLFELLQGQVTATRSVSMSDGYWNIVGIVLGTALVVVLGPIVDRRLDPAD